MTSTRVKKVILSNGMELIVPPPDLLKEYVRAELCEEGGIERLVFNAECYFDIFVALAAQQLKDGKPIVFERDAAIVPGYPVTLATVAMLTFNNRHNLNEATKSSLSAPVTADDIPA